MSAAWRETVRHSAGCFKSLYKHRQGAEIECTLLFPDIRGSTQLAESMSSTDFRGLLDRFYQTAAEVLIRHEAVVGTTDHVEFTALGDNVNVTARLASAAASGEILVTEASACAGGLEGDQRRERRSLDLRGKSEATDVVVLTLASPART